MRKVLVSIILLLCCMLSASAQHKKTISHQKKPTQYQIELMRVIDSLKADSVKIYSFTCGTPIKPPPGIVMMEAPKEWGYREMSPNLLIDSTQHWALTLADSGKIVEAVDIRNVLRNMKYRYLDTIPQPKNKNWIILDEPVACYIPRMGIMFFAGGIVKAHIDVCLECNRMVFEVFDNGHVAYRFSLGVMGPKMQRDYAVLCLKYRMLCCEVDHGRPVR